MYDNTKLAPEYDAAIIGITTDGSSVYSYEKLVEVCKNDLGLEQQDAIDHVDFNLVRTLPYLSEPKSVIMYEEYE